MDTETLSNVSQIITFFRTAPVEKIIKVREEVRKVKGTDTELDRWFQVALDIRAEL